MSLLRYLSVLLVAMLLFTGVYAQIGSLGGAKDIIRKGKEKSNSLNNTDLSTVFASKLKRNRTEYESANFNYAIAFADNAGLFETRERYTRQKATLADGLRLSSAKASDSEVNWSKRDRARHSNSTGEMLYASNKFKAAELAFLNAKVLYDADFQSNTPEMALVLNNLGLLYHTTGRYSKSEEFTQQSLDLRTRISKNSAAHAASLNNKAVLYKDLGRYNEAEALIDEAIEMNLTTVGKKSLPYALAINNKAMLYQVMGRYEQAEKLLLEATEVAKGHLKEKSNNYNKLMINLALLYSDMGKFEEAEATYLRAIELKEKKLGKHHPDYAHLQRGLAALYLQMDRDDNSEELLLSAMEIYRKKFGEDHPSYAATISDLGNMYRASSREDEAQPLLEKALKIRTDLLGKDHPDYANSLEDMALLHWQTGELEQAEKEFREVLGTSMDFIDRYFAPMSESEKAKYWAKLQPRLHRFYGFAVARYGENPSLATSMLNYQMRTKALLLSSSNRIRNAILNSGNSQVITKYREWLDVKEELARLYTLSKAEREEEGVDLSAMEAEANKLEKELSAQSEDFSSAYASKPTAYGDIKGALQGSEALVEIVQFHHFDHVFTEEVNYVALIVKQNSSQPAIINFRNGVELETTAIEHFQNSIYELEEDKKSYQAFWAPIDAKLGSPERVFVSPDGVYNLISLSTLLGPDGKYLVDRYETVMLSNAKEIIELKEAPKGKALKSAKLFGYPTYGDLGKVSMLPGTRVEVNNINKILTDNGYKSTVYLEGDANEGNVKKARAGILHIATHGFFLPDVSRVKREKLLGIETRALQDNPLHRSGLLLANAEATMYGKNGDHSTSDNGILTAYETMNLDLQATELVVLSACETGLGDVKVGEGVYGLQRSFRVAGADAVIMSLWQVSDEATMELMTHFYELYAQSGDKRAAFQAARKKVKEKYPEPFYWGAFVLIGH